MFNKPAILIILSIFSIPAISQTPEYRTKKYDNGNLRYEGWFVGDKPVKELRRYHENGRLRAVQTFDDEGNSSLQLYGPYGGMVAEGHYVKDKRDGEWRYYNSSGGLQMVEHYSEGVYDGDFTSYDLEGKLLEQCSYVKGLLEGTRIEYFPNGNVKAKYAYDHGRLEGEYRSYYYDGYPEYEGAYKDGLKEGMWVYVNDEGLADTLYYEKGISPDMESRIEAESAVSDTISGIADPQDYSDNFFEYMGF